VSSQTSCGQRRRRQIAFLMPLVLLGVVMAGLPAPGSANDMDKANEAYERADYNAAAGYLHPLAEAGDPLAQMRMGVLHHEGLGVDQDDAEAARWWRQAADQGYTDAEYAVGLCYDHGRGVAQDQAEAASWYEKAASKGHTEAQASLGTLYAYGDGVSQDLVLAWFWLSVAASKGNDMARETLDGVTSQMTPQQLAQARKRLQDLPVQ
jgi:TPR repeat protein